MENSEIKTSLESLKKEMMQKFRSFQRYSDCMHGEKEEATLLNVLLVYLLKEGILPKKDEFYW